MKTSNMTLEDAVQVLSNYSLIHVPSMGELDGLCMYYPRLILIDSEQEHPRTTQTIIHELYHAIHLLRGEPNSEARVKKETKQTMKRLYGYEGQK
jgi:hypothetical protein